MDVATWNVLHDGRLIAADGAVPGALTLTVEIAYLCLHLPTQSPRLTIKLAGCERFEYQACRQPVVSDPTRVAALGLELLSAEFTDGRLSVECADGGEGGQLLLRYRLANVTTAEGRELTQASLEAASDRYWTLWEEKARRTE